MLCYISFITDIVRSDAPDQERHAQVALAVLERRTRAPPVAREGVRRAHQGSAYVCGAQLQTAHDVPELQAIVEGTV